MNHRGILALLSICFALAGAVAALPLFEIDVGPALTLSTGPAAVLFFLGDAMGLSMPHNGLFIGHAHGPPFLQIPGIALVYGLPAIGLLFLVLRRPTFPRKVS